MPNFIQENVKEFDRAQMLITKPTLLTICAAYFMKFQLNLHLIDA